jgi:hypothetical protein
MIPGAALRATQPRLSSQRSAEGIAGFERRLLRQRVGPLGLLSGLESRRSLAVTLKPSCVYR